MHVAIVVAFVAVALLVIALRLRVGFRADVRVTDLRALSAELDTRIVEHMRANYSGFPEGLDAAVRPLPGLAREVAARHGEQLDEDHVRMLLTSVLLAHRYAPRDRIEGVVADAVERERGAAA